jgi:hypothetical protein
LHDGDLNALTAPPSHRRYDRPTLDRLQRRLAKTGAQLRGQIDDGRPEWIEPADFMDYELAYQNYPVPGHSMVGVIVARSHYAYPGMEVKDRSARVHGPHAVEPRYRLVVTNLMVETEALLPKVLGATSLAAGSPVLDAPSIELSGGTEPEADIPIAAVIKKRLANGERPGSTVTWDRFCDSIRDDCDAWKNRDKRTIKRGFSDRQIKRRFRLIEQGGVTNVPD